MKLTASIDLASLQRQIKRAYKDYGDSQKQAVKRWGVFTARELALQTQAHGRKAATQKGAMIKDGRNVIMTHKGRVRKTPKGVTYTDSTGKLRSISASKYLNTENEIVRWIERHRTSSRKRTRKLHPSEKAVCTEAKFLRAINQKHRKLSGMAKDGFLDAGEDISRGQRGQRKERIGESYIKWARKPKRLGRAIERGRVMKHSARLENLVSYTKDEYVLKKSNSKRAVRWGAHKMLKWYKANIKTKRRKAK